MKKAEQKLINERCNIAYEEAINEPVIDMERLRTCTAWVEETPNYYRLRSYRTLIAVIAKDTDTLFDCLRIVYGYTATSAQHISKFEKDYGRGMWGCQERLTAR